MKLSPCLHDFFDTYLPDIRGASKSTTKTYRDTFTLFLPFTATYYNKSVDELTLEDISIKLILDFLNLLENQRHNIARTRNLRLATLKSFAKMLEVLHPSHRELAIQIKAIPQKRSQKRLVGFITQEEILTLYKSVEIKKHNGMRDYTILHLLFDSGARASEIAALKLESFDIKNKGIIILGKGNSFRHLTLSLKPAELINEYITKYRPSPKSAYQQILFINKRGEGFTRFGIYRLCKKYLTKTLPAKRLQMLHAVHSFRHGCAMDMLNKGESLDKIKNRLGHEDLQTSMTYLKLDIQHKREIQKRLIAHSQSSIKLDTKIEELISWENKEETLAWLDSL